MSIDTYVVRLNKHLARCLDDNHIVADKLQAAMSYSTLTKAKRFRPVLVYLCAELVAGSSYNKSVDILTKADNPACAIELIHIYSLIHDDLPAMDDDDLRHHQPSCHIKYDEATAILAGDALQSLAMNLLANDIHNNTETRIKLLQILSKYALAMVYGQALDLDSKNQPINTDYLAKIHQYKTGALLRCSVALGSIIAGADANLLAKLDEFAQYFGLAYQIQDDVLDVTANIEVLGKNQSDVQNSKITYVSLLGLEESKLLFVKNYDKALFILQNISQNSLALESLILTLKTRQH